MTFTGYTANISQKIELFIVNDVGNSNPNIVLMEVLSCGRSCIAAYSVLFIVFYGTLRYSHIQP
jgi:hypothetical protein